MIKCKVCGKKPEEISEYVEFAEDEGITPLEYVVENEGTYNAKKGLFYCTSCYIKAGCPLGTA